MEAAWQSAQQVVLLAVRHAAGPACRVPRCSSHAGLCKAVLLRPRPAAFSCPCAAMSLTSAGMATMYLNERLSFGMAPDDIAGVFTQRLRWCVQLRLLGVSTAGTWGSNLARHMQALHPSHLSTDLCAAAPPRKAHNC